MPRLPALFVLPLLLSACGGLTEEEKAAATGGARMVEAGAGERAIEVAEAAEARRREEAAAARKARDEKLAQEEAKRREALRLAMADQAEAEFPDGIDGLVTEGPDGPIFVGPQDDAEYARWAAAEERRVRAMRARAERYHRRYEREAQARGDDPRGWMPEDEWVEGPRERYGEEMAPDYLDPGMVERRREQRVADAERRIRAHQRERERRGAPGLRQPGDRAIRPQGELYPR